MSACLSPLWSTVFVWCYFYSWFVVYIIFSTFFASWTSVPVWFLGWLCQFPGFIIFDVHRVLDLCPCSVPWLVLPVSWIFHFRRVSRLGLLSLSRSMAGSAHAGILEFFRRLSRLSGRPVRLLFNM